MTTTSIGYGTTFSWGAAFTAVLHLTRIGSVSVTLAKVDSTTLAAADSFKTMLPGLLDPGEVALEGWFRPDDPGQAAILADMLTRTERDWRINFPTSLSSATWAGKGYITAFAAGDATPEGIIPCTATLSITGKPEMAVSLCAGMTVMTGIEMTGTTALVIVPTVGAAVYTYVADPIDTNSTWIKLTITAAAPQTIKVTVLGVEHVLTTTELSAVMTIDDAGEVTPVYIEIGQALKSSRHYTLFIQRP